MHDEIARVDATDVEVIPATATPGAKIQESFADLTLESAAQLHDDQIMGRLNVDADGKIRATEVARLLKFMRLRAESVMDFKKTAQTRINTVTKAALFVSFLLLIVLGGNAGLTAAIVVMTKDLSIDSGGHLINPHTGKEIKVQ